MAATLSGSIGRLRMASARLQQRRARRRSESRQDLIRRTARGGSFADIGAMWNVNGELSFLAEEAGATAVTAVDVMPPTEAYREEHRRRGSGVRFVHGDIHDPDVVAAVGPHDVVWCSGVLYHAPNPVLTLERLRALTDRLLILATETIPEVPGLSQACVFLPGLSAPDRRLHRLARPHGTALGIHTPFRPDQGYGNWWWGLSRSAVRGMLFAAGFELREEHGGPLHATFLAAPARHTGT